MGESEAPKKTIKQLREERGLTREELAVALKTHYTTLVNLEIRRSRPRVDLAERIYLFFGVPVGSIDWTKREGKETRKD